MIIIMYTFECRFILIILYSRSRYQKFVKKVTHSLFDLIRLMNHAGRSGEQVRTTCFTNFLKILTNTLGKNDEH